MENDGLGTSPKAIGAGLKRIFTALNYGTEKATITFGNVARSTLGIVCMFSTVLVIYYKQISEGYEDRRSFQIMKKIGMDSKEIMKTINSQLKLQFFFPLVTAGIHTAFALPMFSKLLMILNLANTSLFIVCTVITYALFAMFYLLVYFLTAKTYYKIVR